MHSHNGHQGIPWMVSHCLTLSILAAGIKYLAQSFHPLQIIFLHNAFALMFLSFWLAYKRHWNFKTPYLRMHIWRGVIGITSFMLYFQALVLLPLPEVTAISFTGPLFSVILAIIIFKERLGTNRLFGLIAGFCGMLIIIRPGMEAFNPASMLIVTAVFFWAINSLIIRKLSTTESTTNQLFYLCFILTLLSIPFAFVSWQTPTPVQWLQFMALGAFFLLNAVCVFNAFRLSEIITLMPFQFSQIVFTSIWAYLFFDELIDMWTFIGSTIIVASSVYIHKRQKLKAEQLKELEQL